jgi:CheY-like chemotaxis protein
MLTPRSPADPLRTLIVVDDDDSGRGVAARLGAEFAAGLRTCARPEQALAQVQSHRPDVVVLALGSLEAVERHALALQGAAASAGERPFLLAACSSVGTGAAARMCRQGLIDDYVQHFPVPTDPDRLAASVRLAARIVAPGLVFAGAPATAAPRRPVVLVVEDDEVLHTLVAAMLESERIDLVFEANGSAALERIRTVAPDLVLMDIVLPGGDGVAITEQLKATPELAAIPVVMLTGEARLDTLVRSMEAGAADFIVKPFTREALVAKLSKYLPTGA